MVPFLLISCLVCLLFKCCLPLCFPVVYCFVPLLLSPVYSEIVLLFVSCIFTGQVFLLLYLPRPLLVSLTSFRSDDPVCVC